MSTTVGVDRLWHPAENRRSSKVFPQHIRWRAGSVPSRRFTADEGGGMTRARLFFSLVTLLVCSEAGAQTTGANYTSGVIDRLPVSRHCADIVRSNPGVSTDVGDTEGRFVSLAIYGATSAENQWIVDGVNTTSVSKGTQGKAISNEFVQEV